MREPHARGRARRGRRSATAAAGLLAAAALALALLGWHAQDHAGAPPTAAAHPSAEGDLPSRPTTRGPDTRTPSPAGTSGRTNASTPAVVGPTLPRSKPTRLTIPAIGIDHARLAAYGTNSHREVAIPEATGGVPAGWYTGSPTPGQLGPSVIVGHIDSAADGPSIFYHLSRLRAGDTVRITRADHTVAVFTVDSLETYPKNAFPTAKVYGNINHAGLRLISCTGRFDPHWGHYEDNLVVYAHLTGHHHA